MLVQASCCEQTGAAPMKMSAFQKGCTDFFLGKLPSAESAAVTPKLP